MKGLYKTTKINFIVFVSIGTRIHIRLITSEFLILVDIISTISSPLTFYKDALSNSRNLLMIRSRLPACDDLIPKTL